jgi:hypothetical protein
MNMQASYVHAVFTERRIYLHLPQAVTQRRLLYELKLSCVIETEWIDWFVEYLTAPSQCLRLVYMIV